MQIVDLNAEIAKQSDKFSVAKDVAEELKLEVAEKDRQIASLDAVLTEERKKLLTLDVKVKELETVKRILEQYKRRNAKSAKKAAGK